jgi:hypothetical protein
MRKETAAAGGLSPALSYAELAALGEASLAAAADANAAFSAGLEAINKEVATYARANFASATAMARAALSARTLEELVRLQSDFAKHGFDHFVERTAKLTELGYAMVSASFGAWAARARTPAA